MEAPHVQALYVALKGKPVAIAGINVKDEPAKARAFVSDLKLTYPMLVDTKLTVSQAYQVRGLPTIVLIDKKGRIRYQGYELPSTEDILRVL